MWNLAVEFKQILCYVFMSFNRFEDTGFKVIQVFLLNEFLIVHDPLTFFFTAFFFSPTCPLSLSLPSFPTFKKQRATLFSFHFSSSFFLFACTRSAEIAVLECKKWLTFVCLQEKSLRNGKHIKRFKCSTVRLLGPVVRGAGTAKLSYQFISFICTRMKHRNLYFAIILLLSYLIDMVEHTCSFNRFGIHFYLVTTCSSKLLNTEKVYVRNNIVFPKYLSYFSQLSV